MVPHERFTSRWPDLIRALDARIARRTFTHPIEREWAAFWHARRADIWALVERLETLGRRLRTARPPLVLCHADAHHNNVLIDGDDRLWLVDWDDALLAPKECDLMMGVGGLSGAIVGPREEAWFLWGYGPTSIDPLALAYYRYLRAVGDLATNGEQAWLLPGVGEAVRAEALQRARRLFAPGNIVSLAAQAADRVI
jgi:spectinomycin phosphotransferase